MANPYTTVSREQWSAYREDAAARGEVILPLSRLSRWHPYFPEGSGSAANEALQKVWLKSTKAPPSDKYWTAVQTSIGWSGMIMPLDELNHLGIHQLIEVARAQEFRRNNLGWVELLWRTRELAATTDQQDIVCAGLWEYLPAYAALLQRARTKGQDFRALLQTVPSGDDHSSLVPSHQAVSLLLRYAVRAFPSLWDEADFNRRLELSVPEVRQLFADRVAIVAYLDGEQQPGLFSLFQACCQADVPFIAIQEMIDNKAELGLRAKLPADYRERLADFAGNKLTDRLKKFVGRLSILDRVRLPTSTAPAAAPLFYPDYETLIPENTPAWYELDEEELTALLNEIAGNTELLSPLLERSKEHQRQLLCLLTAPALDWPFVFEKCIPQWAVAPKHLIEKAAKAYEEEQQNLQKELDRIELILPKLRKATTLAAIRDIERKRSPFSSGKANRLWRAALERQRQEIHNQRLFREQKMKEFGVELADFAPSEKDVWLDELLQVEEEVRPYMAYVRKAFAAALPVGSTVEFNPYIHRSDGVEFDPETIQDQDKWLRGEVMKTLRSRKEYAPITQVNTFCLDYSRSMNHDLMRNLFKVVFLLVTGLEGRDTYDAIHFFGSAFKEAVDFTDAEGRTSRKHLARILAKIATIELNSVVYSGFGGTNISDAVEKSHEKIMAFSRKLEQERPDLRYVRSILILTDGQPTVGVINLDELQEYVSRHREDGDVSIKGIYLKHPDDRSDFIARIFGPQHAVEASSFDELIATFVQTMSLTYRQQRKDYRQAQRKKRLLGLHHETD